MTAFLRRALCLLAINLIGPNLCGAQSTDDSAGKSLDGYLGAGVMILPIYVGGANTQTIFVPLAMLEYQQTVYVHLQRAGIRLWSSPDKKMAFGLAGEPRFGFHASDGSRLTGMATRHDAIEGGIAFEWELPQLSLSAAYFDDLSDTSGGQSVRLSLEHQLLDNGIWDISAYIDFDHADASIVQYYFGVPANEATATRPAYQPGSTINSSFGFSGAYLLSKNHALLFGSELTYLGATAAESPIVQRRTGVTTYIGLGWVF